MPLWARAVASPPHTTTPRAPPHTPPPLVQALYGRGYHIEVSLLGIGARDAAEERDRIERVTALVRSAAPTARLTEANAGHLRFEAEDLTLSLAFAALERARLGGVLRDFSLSQTTLESVFLRFSKMQEAADDAHTRSG